MPAANQIGVLQLKLLKGKYTNDQELLGKMDVFAIVRLG